MSVRTTAALVLLAWAAGCSDSDGSAAHDDGGRPAVDAAGATLDAAVDPGSTATDRSDAGSDASVSDGGSGGSSSPPPGDDDDSGIPFIPRLEVRKLDLLFIVDDSRSMQEEQAALRAQFPAWIRALTTGDRDLDGSTDFVPAGSLHLGVVSSDMGLVGITGIPGCEDLGDDGIMNDVPDPALVGCEPSYPRFLTHVAGADDPDETATDFGCIASLGTAGCGFEQQLESGLKALWPSVDYDPFTGITHDPNRITFLGDAMGGGQLGHGDVENLGFLDDDTDNPSVLVVVLVTDEDDCSSHDTSHFTPTIFLDPSDPLYSQDLDLRCHYNPGNLHPLQRYDEAWHWLRPDHPQRVMFIAITGVPPDLVDDAALASVSFTDAVQVDAYYQQILDDARMQAIPDLTLPEGTRRLYPSCTSDNGSALPPRRIVGLAQRFGKNGFVQSICGDFGDAFRRILARVAYRLDHLDG